MSSPQDKRTAKPDCPPSLKLDLMDTLQPVGEGRGRAPRESCGEEDGICKGGEDERCRALSALIIAMLCTAVVDEVRSHSHEVPPPPPPQVSQAG